MGIYHVQHGLVVCLVVIQTIVKDLLMLNDTNIKLQVTTTSNANTIIQYMNDYKTDYHYGLILGPAAMVVVHLVVIQTTVQQTDTRIFIRCLTIHKNLKLNDYNTDDNIRLIPCSATNVVISVVVI